MYEYARMNRLDFGLMKNIYVHDEVKGERSQGHESAKFPRK